MPPAHTFKVSPDHVPPLSIFIALRLLLIVFSTGRRRVEHALRASEARFRTVVQFSFNMYWESDAQHRFTRQEFAERLTDAPPPSSEIGKTRWEVPYLEPDEETWRKHRAMLDAHLPFRDFELAATADGRSATWPCPECPCSMDPGSSSATAALGGTSPSASARRTSTGSTCGSSRAWTGSTAQFRAGATWSR